MRMRRLLFLLNIGGGDRNVTARSELMRRELSVGALHDIPRSVTIDGNIGFAVAVVIARNRFIRIQAPINTVKSVVGTSQDI